MNWRAVAIVSFAAAAGCLHALDELPLTACQANGSCAPGFACNTSDLFCHPVADAGFDGGKPRDAGVDAGFDAGVDAGTDAGVDAGLDAGFDAGPADAGCPFPTAASGGITPRAGFALTVDGTTISLAGGVGTCFSPLGLYHFSTQGTKGSEALVGTALVDATVGLTGDYSPGPPHRMFLFGGIDNGVPSKSTVEFDPTNAVSVSAYAPLLFPLAWMASASLAVQMTAPGGTAVDDLLFFLVGGVGADGGPSGALLVFDQTANDTGGQQWYQPDAGMPTARSHLGAAVGPGELLYAIGGEDDVGQPVAGVDAFNVAASCLDAAGVLAGAIVGDGGGGACGWSTPTQLPTPRTKLAVTTGPDGLIYAIGGVTAAGFVSGLVEAYNPADGGWITLPPLNIPRQGHGAATTSDGYIWVLGGIDAAGAVIGSVEVYDPSSDGGWILGGQ